MGGGVDYFFNKDVRCMCVAALHACACSMYICLECIAVNEAAFAASSIHVQVQRRTYGEIIYTTNLYFMVLIFYKILNTLMTRAIGSARSAYR